jgi:hypothetical protein
MRNLAGLAFLLFAQESAPLSVASVTARQDSTKVALTFSRPVEQATAEVAGHYSIDNGIKIESAARSTLDLRVVTLTVSPLSEGVTYTLWVKNVRDCSTPALAVPAETKKSFGFAQGLLGGAPREEAAGSHRPPMPRFKQAVLFNTPEADPILTALQVFPKNNPWNEDVSKAKVHPDSARIIGFIGAEKSLVYNRDMAFILVPRDQPRVEVKIRDTASESDKGPFPVAENTPVEEWPMNNLSLEAGQKGGGQDRHAIVVDPAGGTLYEFYQLFKRSGWECSGESTFDLKTNHMRPRGWTSSDAAGLPIFPSLPRFDEVERGAVEHALRFTVQRTRKGYLYPARHDAPTSDSPAAPAMGQRFRLKSSVDLAGFGKHALAIAQALKKYGMFVADNGGDWHISVPPDKRITGLEALLKLKGRDFEVIVTTGESEMGRPN